MSRTSNALTTLFALAVITAIWLIVFYVFDGAQSETWILVVAGLLTAGAGFNAIKYGAATAGFINITS
jgi:hypothetical protein